MTAGRLLQDVARDAGMSPSQLSKLEAGEHDPQWSTVERVLKALAPGEAMDPLTLLQQMENDLA
ncbi:MAG: helix-turn-helix domain-containing protein [Chloroflexota bacterium]|nr:helix-turn-helix domain-containing protein [Chloroflexota bacterium]